VSILEDNVRKLASERKANWKNKTYTAMCTREATRGQKKITGIWEMRGSRETTVDITVYSERHNGTTG
jgi:hypothetical protein